MSMLNILIAGVAILILAIVYFLSVEQQLKPVSGADNSPKTPALDGGDEPDPADPEPPPDEGGNDPDPGAQPDSPVAKAGRTRGIDPHTSYTVNAGRKPEDEKEVSRGGRRTPAGTQGASHTIFRKIDIAYLRQIYVEQTFNLTVELLAGEAQDKSAASEEDVTLSDYLSFTATEKQPLVEVSLIHAEDDFRVARNKIRRKLENDREHFQFLVIPLKAATSPITVAISYLQPVMEGERLREKSVSTREKLGEGRETTETLVYEPGGKSTKAVEVYAADLAVTAKSMWGLTEGQARFWQRALAPTVIVILLTLALLSGKLDVDDSMIMLVIGLAESAGIAVLPELKKSLTGSG